MDLHICFESGTELELEAVQAVEVSGPHKITVTTFGNGPVVHKNVSAFRFEGDFDFTTVEEADGLHRL